MTELSAGPRARRRLSVVVELRFIIVNVWRPTELPDVAEPVNSMHYALAAETATNRTGRGRPSPGTPPGPGRKLMTTMMPSGTLFSSAVRHPEWEIKRRKSWKTNRRSFKRKLRSLSFFPCRRLLFVLQHVYNVFFVCFFMYLRCYFFHWYLGFLSVQIILPWNPSWHTNLNCLCFVCLFVYCVWQYGCVYVLTYCCVNCQSNKYDMIWYMIWIWSCICSSLSPYISFQAQNSPFPLIFSTIVC